MKLGTNIHHMNGHCRTGLQGHGVKGQGHRNVHRGGIPNDGSPSMTILLWKLAIMKQHTYATIVIAIKVSFLLLVGMDNDSFLSRTFNDVILLIIAFAMVRRQVNVTYRMFYVALMTLQTSITYRRNLLVVIINPAVTSERRKLHNDCIVIDTDVDQRLSTYVTITGCCCWRRRRSTSWTCLSLTAWTTEAREVTR